jgi:hypothetical protein
MPQNEVKIIITTDASGAVTGFKQVGDAATGSMKKIEADTSSFSETVKKHWLAITATAVVAYAAINKAAEYAKLGAGAQQAEEAFRALAESHKMNADSILSNLRRVTAGTIEDSALMQRALKAISLDLPEKVIVGLGEAARVAARTMGVSVKEAFDRIYDSIATGMPRALKATMLITKEEMANLNKAFASGLDPGQFQGIMAQIVAVNAVIKGFEMQSRHSFDNASEVIQRHEAAWNDLKETIGKITIVIFPILLGTLQWIMSNFFLISRAIWGASEAFAYLMANMTSGESQKGWERAMQWAHDAAAAAKELQEASLKKGAQNLGLEPVTPDKKYTKVQYDAALKQQAELDKKLKEMASANEAKQLQKTIDELSNSVEGYRTQLVALNPELSESDKKFMQWGDAADELMRKIDQAEKVPASIKEKLKEDILQIWGQGFDWLTAVDTRKMIDQVQEVETELRTIRATSRQKDFEDLDTWMRQEIEKYKENYSALLKLQELYDQKRADIIDKQAKEAGLSHIESIEALVPAYEEATKVTDVWGESTKEHLARVIEKQKEWMPLLEDTKKQLEEEGLKGSTAYNNITDAIQKAHNAQLDLTQGAEKAVREYENNFNDIEALTRDTLKGMESFWEDIFAGRAKDSFKNLCDFIKGTFSRLLAEMITMALARPIIVPVVQVAQSMMGTAGQMIPGMTTTGAGITGVGLMSMVPGVGTIAAGGMMGGNFGYGMMGGAALGLATGMGGLGGGSVLAALGGTGAFGGELAAWLATSSLAIPVIGVAIGGIALLLSSLFGGGKKTTPQMELGYGIDVKHKESYQPTGYYGDSRVQVMEGEYHFFSKKLGEEAMVFGEAAIVAFKKIRETSKGTLEALGLDVSGFNKVWSKWIDGLENMTEEQVQEALKNMMTDYIAFASGIDFEKFRKEGEKVADTIDLMITAMASIATIVKPKWDETTKSGWDIAKMYDNINLHANTYKEALDQTDKKINDNIKAMNDMASSKAFDPEEWRTKMEEIGVLIQDRYNLEIEYLTYIKTLQEEVKTKIAAQIEKYTVDQFTTMAEQWSYVVGKLAKDWDSFIGETDPTKIATLFNSLTEGMDQLYNMAVNFKNMADSLAESAASTYEKMYTDTLNDQEKIKYYNKEFWDTYAKYEAAKGAGLIDLQTKYGQQLIDLANTGWGLTGIDKTATLNLLKPVLDEIETDARANSKAVTDLINTVIIPSLQSFADTVNTKLAAAIDAEILALDNMKKSLELINYAPLYELGSAASHAAMELWKVKAYSTEAFYRPPIVTSAQSGLDYVPYNNYPANLHRGESVITASGNKALQMILEKLSKDGGSTQPINIYVSDLVDVAIEGGSNLAIRKIKSNPEVLRR